MMVLAYSDSTYEEYLHILADLVSRPSVFTNENDVRQLAQHCEAEMKGHLADWDVSMDEAGNVIVVNPLMDKKQPILYLCAHIDTVGADPAGWQETSDPFTATITDGYIVGRG